MEPVRLMNPRTHRTAGLRWLLLALALLPLATLLVQGQEPTSLERRVASLESRSSVDRGARIFRRSCAACHGVDGRGDGPGAADLTPVPRDLTTAGYRFRTTPSGEMPLPGDLERTIRQGLPGSSMPGFRDLFSQDELDDLIAYVYSLRPGFDPSTDLPEAMTFAPITPVADADQDAGNGEALYRLVGCWRCHGLAGDGRGPAAKTLTDEEERPLPSTDFRHDPFKGERTVEAVVGALRTGLNGTPMPSYDEAMMLVRGDVGDAPSLEGLISTEAQQALRAFLDRAPTAAELGAMSDEERATLRDRRLAALARYVLSFDRRPGVGSRLFHQRPEREARKR